MQRLASAGKSSRASAFYIAAPARKMTTAGAGTCMALVAKLLPCATTRQAKRATVEHTPAAKMQTSTSCAKCQSFLQSEYQSGLGTNWWRTAKPVNVACHLELTIKHKDVFCAFRSVA